MKYIIDRIEGSIAILESQANGEMVELECRLLPAGSKEGDILVEDNGRYTVLTDEKEEREGKIQKLMDRLFED